jgi:hypothetical protein
MIIHTRSVNQWSTYSLHIYTFALPCISNFSNNVYYTVNLKASSLAASVNSVSLSVSCDVSLLIPAYRDRYLINECAPAGWVLLGCSTGVMQFDSEAAAITARRSAQRQCDGQWQQQQQQAQQVGWAGFANHRCGSCHYLSSCTPQSSMMSENNQAREYMRQSMGLVSCFSSRVVVCEYCLLVRVC